MKKFVFSLVFVVLVSSFAFADFGLSLKLGSYGGDNNLDKIKINFDNVPYTHSRSFGADENIPVIAYGFDAFYEQASLFSLSEKSILGAKLGYSGYPNKYSGYKLIVDDVDLSEKLESSVSGIPLTIYYKYALHQKFRVFGGLGLSFLSNEWTYTSEGKSQTKSQTAIAPLINAGIEWKFSKLFSLSADLGYLMNAKFESDYKVDGKKLYNDLSGISFNFAFNVFIF